jgi:hypothetical protein
VTSVGVNAHTITGGASRPQCGHQGVNTHTVPLPKCHLIRSEGVNAYSISPWVHQFCNVVSHEHQTRVVGVPDVNPAESLSLCNFSMAAGDFLEVYLEPGESCNACNISYASTPTPQNVMCGQNWGHVGRIGTCGQNWHHTWVTWTELGPQNRWYNQNRCMWAESVHVGRIGTKI